MDVMELQRRLGVAADGVCGPKTRAALSARLTNTSAPALTAGDFAWAADRLGIGQKMIRAVRKVEAPRGAFDDQGRPSILYERHKFCAFTDGRFTAGRAQLSWPKWVPGTYGPFSAQYGKLLDACALDPGAALRACSWGAFQVLGEHAERLGYGDALSMAEALTASERAHLESFVRYVERFGLVDELRQCRAGDALSCVPFVRGYNGPGYAKVGYHVKLAAAAA